MLGLGCGREGGGDGVMGSCGVKGEVGIERCEERKGVGFTLRLERMLGAGSWMVVLTSVVSWLVGAFALCLLKEDETRFRLRFNPGSVVDSVAEKLSVITPGESERSTS